MRSFERYVTTAGALAAAIIVAGCSGSGQSAGLSATGTVTQLSFATPEDAVAALADAAATSDTAYMRSIFGPEVAEFSSGDADVDAFERQLFAAAIARRSELSPRDGGGFDVLVGERRVPFPAPIVQTQGRWIFDTLTGVDRLADQRVGFNELRTISGLRAIAAAQAEYRTADRDGDSVPEYAARVLSTPDLRDGLYWPTADNEPNSPLGAFYPEGEVPASASLGYHGYFFVILTSQGPGAPGGARDYFDAGGNLVGGFAVLAYPAVYGETGIMSFQMGADGVVLQKDLGPETTRTAGNSIRAFDAAAGWTPAQD